MSVKIAGGFFARNAEVLRRAGDVLLNPATRSDVQLKRWLVAKDAFDLADGAASKAIFEVGLSDFCTTLHAQLLRVPT